MSTKTEIYHASNPVGTYLFEEAIVDVSPAYRRVGPGRFKIEHEFADRSPQVTIEIPAEEMDRLSIAWCKHRKLHSAAGKEFGSPDGDYD